MSNTEIGMTEIIENVIWHIDIPIQKCLTIQLPCDSTIFDLMHIKGSIKLFIIGNPNSPIIDIELRMFTNETKFTECNLKYIGTISIFEGGPIYHIFEKFEMEENKDNEQEEN